MRSVGGRSRWSSKAPHPWFIDAPDTPLSGSVLRGRCAYLARVGVAQVVAAGRFGMGNGAHRTPTGVRPSCSRSRALSILPTAVLGRSSSRSRRSGNLNRATWAASRNRRISRRETGSCPGRGTITTHTVSSPSGPGTPTAATSATDACWPINVSSSAVGTFSPARLMTSFVRPSTTRLPDTCRRARSPVRYQPSSVNALVLAP